MRSLLSIDWMVTWSRRSQDGSRRNAQRAAILCAQRRRERETVDQFLSGLESSRHRVTRSHSSRKA